ncbi:MAG: hypothetical protein IJX46_00005, partial [Clostridia bacterium]|nr:hypothetical protein [Clostridia bacterium]
AKQSSCDSLKASPFGGVWLAVMLRKTAPERAWLPSQSLRASSPKGRAIVLTAFEAGFSKICLNPSNSDLSVYPIK